MKGQWCSIDNNLFCQEGYDCAGCWIYYSYLLELGQANMRPGKASESSNSQTESADQSGISPITSSI